jgi:integrase
VETRRRIPGNLTYHLNPAFPGPIRAITTTQVLEWLAGRLSAGSGVASSSVKLYYDLFATIMRSAERDRVIPADPCRGIKLGSVFRGLSRAPRWIPIGEQVLRLFDAVPERYRAALWLGAGQGCRIGEVLALENSPQCFDLPRAELHVVQQLRYDAEAYGGFFLKEPKGGSAGTIPFDKEVQRALENHLLLFGATEVELVDATAQTARPRTARLLFTDAKGRPFHDRRWAEHWVRWRDAAGWPTRHGTFHALRHFCATTLLANGVDPQHVQKTLRHASLQFTLSTYVHWLPKGDRPANVVSQALRTARRTVKSPRPSTSAPAPERSARSPGPAP